MPRPRHDPHAIATRARLLDAASAVFAAVGYSAARLEDIAARAGIRRPSLLYHFASKDELYAAVIRQRFEALSGTLGAALTSSEALPARLEALERAFVGFVDRDPDFAALLLREMLDGQGPGRALVLDGIVPLLDAVDQLIVEQGQDLLRPGVPRRVVLLQVASHAVVRAASGPLRGPLWGGAGDASTLAIALLGPQQRP